MNLHHRHAWLLAIPAISLRKECRLDMRKQQKSNLILLACRNMKDACLDLMQILKDPCKDLAGTYLRFFQDKNSEKMGEDPARSSSGSI